MYILLQHFPFKSKALVKAFEQILDIENYMNSQMETQMNGYDYYAGSCIMHRKLTESPNYDGVIGHILNHSNDSNGIIYRIEDNLDECFMLIKFATDTMTNRAPWIKMFAETYNGDDFINADNIINTNDWKSYLEDNYDKDYIVYLKIKN